MWTRVNGMTMSKFRKNEDGAILVFFALCVAGIFLVAALSFDIGRRASTQTELQSFTDHVALAAAGELNGFPGAITRATEAANKLIEDSYVIGEGDRVLGPGDFHLYFYETLPDSDEAPLTGELAQDVSLNDSLARFVRVAMINDPARGDAPGAIGKQVQVPWVFARILSIFGTSNLPSEFVGAESVAGYTSFACDVAPVFFCMPDDNPATPEADWNPNQHIGKTIRLREGGGSTGGGSGGGYWEPGNFTWLDIREQVPDTYVDLDGPCKNLSGNNLYECLFAAEGGTTLCFANGLLTTLPGQKEGNVAAVFDTRFDIYRSSSSQVANNSHYRPAPVVTKAYKADGVCSGTQVATTTTMALTPDDCFATNSCNFWPGEERFGDGNWEDGRLRYVETNYSRDAASTNNYTFIANKSDASNSILNGGPIVKAGGSYYHRDDPFRPEPVLGTDYTAQELKDAGFVSNPSADPADQIADITKLYRNALINQNLPGGQAAYNYDDFPVIPNGETRWDYYQAEVASSLYSVPKAIFNPNGTPDTLDPVTGDVIPGDKVTEYNATGFTPLTSPRELIRDIQGPASASYNRTGASLPYCSQTNGNTGNFAIDPKRRTLVAAAVDCNTQKINGKTKDVRAKYFIEVFLVSPSDDDPVDKKKKEIFVEIISPALNTGEVVTRPGRFRNLVQLYRHKTLSQ